MSPNVEDIIEKCGGFTYDIEGTKCTVIPKMDQFIDCIMLDVIYSMKGRKSIGGSLEDHRTEVHIKDAIHRFGVSDQALRRGPHFVPGVHKVSLGKKLKRNNSKDI